MIIASQECPSSHLVTSNRTNCKIVKLFHSRFIKDVPLRLPRVGTAVSLPGCVLCKSGKTDPKEANKNITTNTIEHRTPQSLFPLLKRWNTRGETPTHKLRLTQV